MGTVGDNWDDEERSVIGDKGEIGFIDYEDDKSVCSYNPIEEGPIVISVPFPFVGGKPQSACVGDTVFDSISIENTTTDPVELWSVNIYASTPEDSFTLSLMAPPSKTSDVDYIQAFLESTSLEDRVLRPGQTLVVWLSCKPKEIGLHTSAVHFAVGDDTIERVAFILAEDKISQSLASNRPYRRGRKKKVVADVFSVDVFVTGSRPAKASNRGYQYRLPKYPVPPEVRESMRKRQIPDAISEGLRADNYCSYFKTLISMEEIKMEEDMREYDMKCIALRKKWSEFLALEVPGLAERRPSLVYGDFIFVKLSSKDGNDSTHPYQGYIHRVEAEEVCLKFDKEFHLQHRAGNLYNVQFTFNRVNMRRLYQAIEAAKSLGEELLFPSQSYTKRRIEPSLLTPISCNLNEEQRRSIEMILGCKGGPPYVIHGPPGTGKTVTLVETILQIYTKRKHARILVCAPSNSAADHILEKLISEKGVKVYKDEVFRLNAISRPFEDVNPDLLDFCYFDDDSIFNCPHSKNLMHYKIIISTYMSASLLYVEGVKRGHFSHIILDEAGQASEPETMIPLSHLCKYETTVVLAGDPMQLGPVIYSKEAETYGYGKSYLERLFEHEFYSNSDENYVTKLVRNYRCHPEILYLPSKLFYNGELIACRDDTSSSMTWMDLLPNVNFPVLFIGLQGLDEREGNNPSWFNRFEASKIVETTERLIAEKGLSEEDIGIITPYRQQVLKLRKTFESLGRSGIKVGSVEQFQGQEKQVIMISTVRSTVKHNEFDRNHCLGFLSNPRRFNVAITRAKSLLIVIGNPHIICKDPYWNMQLWHCSDNGSYQGCPLPKREECSDEHTPTEESSVDYEKENPQPSDKFKWADECERADEFSERAKEFCEPVVDEADWSDGWK